MEIIEQLSVSRRRMLIGFLIGYGSSHGASIAAAYLMDPDYGTRISRLLGGVLSFCSLGGFAVFAIYLCRLILLRRKVSRDPALDSALNDELVNHNRLKAYRFAFLALICAQLTMIFGGYLYPPLLRYGVHSSLYVALISFISAFLYYDLRAEHG
jgi:hypothetical protein